MEKIDKSKINEDEKIVSKKEKTNDKVSVSVFLDNFQMKEPSLKYLKPAFIPYVTKNKLTEGKTVGEWEKIFMKFMQEGE